MTNIIQADAGGVTLWVRVSSRGSKSSVASVVKDAVKITRTAPPVDGATNAMLIETLAKLCKIPKSSISIMSGETDALLKGALAVANIEEVKKLSTFDARTETIVKLNKLQKIVIGFLIGYLVFLLGFAALFFGIIEGISGLWIAAEYWVMVASMFLLWWALVQYSKKGIGRTVLFLIMGTIILANVALLIVIANISLVFAVILGPNFVSGLIIIYILFWYSRIRDKSKQNLS